MPDSEAIKAVFTINRALADWATIAVFVGLLGDILVIFLFRKDKPKSETWLAFICTLTIALGVYGEYRFGGKASQAAADLQRLSDERVAGLNKEAGDARKAAADLVSQIQPRDLTQAQRDKIRHTFRPFVGRQVSVASYAEPESLRLGFQIRKALVDAGMDPKSRDVIRVPLDSAGGSIPLLYGIATLIGDTSGGVPTTADADMSKILSAWLKAPVTRGSFGFPVLAMMPVGVMVGVKPLPEDNTR